MKNNNNRETGILNRVTISCVLAGMTEMYDFVIFGLLVNIINDRYLSFTSGNNAIVISYMLFATAFLFRPIGALVFGYIGDVYGRKTALATSVSMIGFASLSLCFLPPYELLGVSACYMIAIIRAIQGFSVGGEITGGIVYAIEHFDKKRSGFAGSFVIGGCLLGILLATMVANIVQLPFMPEYAWRIAFFVGFILSSVGFFIRSKLSETPDFRQIKIRKGKIPLISGVKKYKLQSITALLVGASCGANVFYMVVYLPSYLTKMIGVNLSYVSIISTSIMMVFSPFFGWISDKMNRGKLIFIGAVLTRILHEMEGESCSKAFDICVTKRFLENTVCNCMYLKKRSQNVVKIREKMIAKEYNTNFKFI